MKPIVTPILLATIWIGLSEFMRNEFLLKEYWIEHYADMGITFPSDPVNGAIWGLWSLLFAIFIYIISRRFQFMETALISWFGGFVLMWVVTGNLDVLPFHLLYAAVPLSLLEVFVATWLIKKFSTRSAEG